MTAGIESEPVDTDSRWAVAACAETAHRIGGTHWEMLRSISRDLASAR